MSKLAATRPTAVNLRWALAEMQRALSEVPEDRRLAAAMARAGEIAEADVAINRAIGEHGAALIAEAWQRKGARRPGRGPDALQCRLARHGRLGHRARPGLPRPR